MLFSIVTVVRNDLPGLQATLSSAAHLLRDGVEQWVIDGSTDDAIRNYLTALPPGGRVQWISEPDGGIFDAMNKGLDRATGNHVLFLNAGDTISPLLDDELLFRSLREERRVMVGHTVERWQGESWLRPGVGREQNVYSAPPHQATFYPRSFYATKRYRLDLKVSADADYTRRAMGRCGAVYLPTIVCDFSLGGLSSHYGKLTTVMLRIRQCGSVKGRCKLAMKAVLWKLLSQRSFYRLLAIGKYTRLTHGRPVTLGLHGVPSLQPTER